MANPSYTPTVPVGETSPVTGTTYTFQSYCNDATYNFHAQYVFDWGDGTTTTIGGSMGNVIPSMFVATHSWATAGIYQVKCKIRWYQKVTFTVYTHILPDSAWSPINNLIVTDAAVPEPPPVVIDPEPPVVPPPPGPGDPIEPIPPAVAYGASVSLSDFTAEGYLFWPDISSYKKITITNNGLAAITPELSFGPNGDIDTKFWKTMRIRETNTGIQDAHVLETSWTGVINAGASKDLYVWSENTKEGWSWRYPSTHWTASGGGSWDPIHVNDGNETVPCIAWSPGGNHTITLDVLSSEAFRGVKVSADGAVLGTFSIWHSDDNITYTQVTPTVPATPDLAVTTANFLCVTVYWGDMGTHRYWRIRKENAPGGGNSLTEVQWLLFEPHKGAYDFGVYGLHSAVLVDATGGSPDRILETNIMIVPDIIQRTNYDKPIGKVGIHTASVLKNIERYGKKIQLLYTPTNAWLSDTTPATPDTYTYSYVYKENCAWNIRGIVLPGKRRITQSVVAAAGVPADSYLNQTVFQLEDRYIYFQPYGPDYVGWYLTEFDFGLIYGGSYYVIMDNLTYKIEDLKPIYYGDEIVAMGATIFDERSLKNLTRAQVPRVHNAYATYTIKVQDNYFTRTYTSLINNSAGSSTAYFTSLQPNFGVSGGGHTNYSNQLYYDPDCLIPVFVTGGGVVYVNGHSVATPSRLYLKA